MNLYVIDIEGDGLTPSKIHVMSWMSKDGIKSTKDYDEMRTLLAKADVIVGHNFIQFDKVHIERLLGIELKAFIVDTLAVSWYLYPERLKHGLESWAETLGTHKPNIDDWDNLSYEVYKDRCENDIITNSKLWELFWNYLFKLYGDKDKIWTFLRYLSFKMDCLALQEKNKWQLDVEYVQRELIPMKKELEEKKVLLEKAMPPVPVYKVKRYPAKMYKKDGSLSSHGQEWFQLLEANKLDKDYADDVKFVSHYTEPNANSPDQIKSWLFSLGWEPLIYKHTKNKETGEEKDIPQIYKDRSEGLCESVLFLIEKEPAIEHLNGLSILKHRIPFLEGLLEARDSKDFVVARAAGFTNTLRLKHAELVNMPKIDRPYGKVIRGSLISRRGRVLFGSDLSSLEDRIKQHFMYKFDPELVEEMNEEGYDPHLKLALAAGVVTLEQVNAYKDGSNKSIKPVRDVFKNGNYACQYGAFPPRLAITCKVDLDKAKEIFDAYWLVNKSIKLVVEEQVWKEVEGQKWLYNPVSDFWYSLRYTKDIFSTLVQGTASYVFDLWLGFVLVKCKDLVGQFHDEFILDVEEGYEEGVTEYIKDCMNSVNEMLNLNRKLDCEVQYGKRYSEIH